MVYLSQLLTTLMASAKEFFSYLNWVDLIVLSILLRTSYIGIRRGLFIEITKTTGFLLGIMVAITQYAAFGSNISQRMNLHPALSQGIAFGGIVLITYLGVRFCGFVLQKVLKVDAQGFWGRFWGAEVGLIRGLLVSICLLTSVLFTQSGYLTESIQEKSLLAPILVKWGSSAYQSLQRFSSVFTVKKIDQKVSKDKEASD